MASKTRDTIRLLAIGDVVGDSGKKTVEKLLSEIHRKEDIDFTLANVENLSGGIGVMPEEADEILSYGVDVLTSGNHIWAKKDINSYLEQRSTLLRPFNYSDDRPGRGMGVYNIDSGVRVGVINAVGKGFMENSRSPFKGLDRIVSNISKQSDVAVMDFHAEATSEKNAMGWYMNGKLSAVIGTHTHIPTADARVLPGGTAYITDIGMTGSYNSVIGIKKEDSLKRFVYEKNVELHPAKGDERLCGAVITADSSTGSALDIKRLEVAL